MSGMPKKNQVGAKRIAGNRAGTGERAYACAKACGIIGKSFVGKRISALQPVTRLSELDRLIFGAAARELPERELLPDLEKRILVRAVVAVMRIVNCFREPPELLSLLVSVYEYADLKSALAMLADNPHAPKPAFIDIGKFRTINFEAWPDLKLMLKGTDYEFVLKKSAVSDINANGQIDAIEQETALDRLYYQKVWKALFKLKKGDRIAAEKIIREEIALRNAAWVLRLRTYYGMKAEEVRPHLIEIPGHKELAADAIAALDLPLDSRREWENWKRIDELNPEGMGAWKADPRFFQNSAAEKLYRLALRNFRAKPMSLDTVFCFIKLKQFEEDLLTSYAEGMGLGMSGRDVFELLEIA